MGLDILIGIVAGIVGAWMFDAIAKAGEYFEKVRVKLDEKSFIPNRAHELDAGYDLKAMDDIYVPCQGKITADTGVHIEIPAGHFGDIRPKSGLLFNHNIVTFGTVDAGYSGAVKVRIINLGTEPYRFKKRRKNSTACNRSVQNSNVRKSRKT